MEDKKDEPDEEAREKARRLDRIVREVRRLVKPVSPSPAPEEASKQAVVPTRPRCPFYGFEWDEAGKVFREADKRCGGLFGLSAPCKREQDGRTIDIDRCSIGKALRRLVDRTGAQGQHWKFFPREHPEGILYPAWRDEVLAAADRAAEEREKAMREEARKEMEAWRKGDTAWWA